MLIKRMELGPFLANCYLVACSQTKKAIVIDPGAEGEYIINQVQALGLHVRCIVNTHAHIDHVGANAAVKDALGVPILAHVADAPLYRSPQAGAALFRDKGNTAAPDQVLREGDLLEVGTLKIRVLETPGHTAGSITLDINGILFTGDTLFAGSIGRTDFPGGSYRQIIKSIKDKILVYADETQVFPGHGPSTTVGNERRYNPFLT